MARSCRSSEKGFTVVELLLVVVVIAILAVITTITFTSISNRAVVASIQSDLKQASKQISVHRVSNGNQLPQSVSCPSANASEICLNLSGDNRVEYYGVSPTDPTKYVLQISNGSTTFSVDGSGFPRASSLAVDALVSRFDANNTASYTGDSSTLYDLVGNSDASLSGVTYAELNGRIELLFDGVSSILYVPNVEIGSIFMMVYLDGSQVTSRYLLDTRPGNPSGYIYNNGVGNWKNLMVNGELISSSLAAIPKDQWVGFYAETDSTYTTIRMGIMSRSSNGGEKHAGKLGDISIFNRKLSAEEVKQAFEFYKPRYGL